MLERIILFLSQDYARNKLNIEYGRWIAIFGHFFYWYIWTYVFPQPYESTVVRFSAILLFAPFLFKKFFPKKDIINALLDLYWYVCLGYNLPFLFTYLMLMNNFSGMWLICETMAILMTVILVSNNILLLFMTLGFGIILAVITFYFQGVEIYFENIHLEYLLVMPMVAVGGMIFNFSTKLLEEKNRILKSSLAGSSIAHELRNSLSSIRISAASIDVDLKFLNIAELNKMAKENLIKSLYIDKSINI